MLTNQDIVNIIEKHKSFQNRISELYLGYHVASTKEEYEQWLKEEIK